MSTKKNDASFGYFKRKKMPNYPNEARKAANRSRDRRSTMNTRRPSVLRSIAHREMLNGRIEREREMVLHNINQKKKRIKIYRDHKCFPGLVGMPLQGDEQVVEIHRRPTNLARSLSFGQSPMIGAEDFGTVNVKMAVTKVRLSRNKLLQSALPEIDYLLRFKQAAFEKAHCPLPERYEPKRAGCFDESRPMYSTAASTDVESLRKLEDKHGRGWMADPYLDSNPGGVATYGCNKQSSLNFRNHQPLPQDVTNFTLRNSASAQDLIKRKQWMTLSSPALLSPAKSMSEEERRW